MLTKVYEEDGLELDITPLKPNHELEEGSYYASLNKDGEVSVIIYISEDWSRRVVLLSGTGEDDYYNSSHLYEITPSPDLVSLVSKYELYDN